MLGLSDGKIMNMALDRIEHFSEINHKSITNVDIDFREYFDDSGGVSVSYGKKPQNIILKIEKSGYKYIVTKTMHH